MNIAKKRRGCNPGAKKKQTDFSIPGNRCGHDPSAPRSFVPPEGHAKRPGVLRKIINGVRGYFDTPGKIPTLNAVNGSTRQQRSERREACILVMSAAIHYLDLVTLRVGVPQDDKSFLGITMKKLAEIAGIGLRRAERAAHDLVAAGIMTVYPICEQVGPGEFVGRAAIRTIPSSLFGIFAAEERLKHERTRASKRRRQGKPPPPTRTDAARMNIALNAARNALGGHAAKSSESVSTHSHDNSTARSRSDDVRRQIEDMDAIRLVHPTFSDSEVIELYKNRKATKKQQGP